MKAGSEMIATMYCCECQAWHTWRVVHRPGSRRPYRAQLRTGRQLIEQHKAASKEEAVTYIKCAMLEDGAIAIGVGQLVH